MSSRQPVVLKKSYLATYLEEDSSVMVSNDCVY